MNIRPLSNYSQHSAWFRYVGIACIALSALILGAAVTAAPADEASAANEAPAAEKPPEYCMAGDYQSRCTVVVSGAGKTGVYKKLTDAFNAAAAIAEERCGISCGDNQTCKTTCDKTIQFEHCESSGSIENLRRLGMQRSDGETDEAKKEEKDPACVSKIQFALVQNYFAHKATKAPSQEFEGQEAGLDGYKRFENLRTVLPMYNGYVQIVTTQQANEKDDIKKLKDLADQRIYFSSDTSVSYFHGLAVFDRHPSLSGEDRPNLLCARASEYGRCEKMDFSVLEGLPPNSWKPKTGDQPEKLPSSDLLLACGHIDAYVASGTLKPMQAIECGDKSVTRRQVIVDEIIVDALSKDLPYYRKAPSPEVLKQDNFDAAMPTVTTYLVSSSNVPPSIVKRVTDQLYRHWPNLQLLDDKLSPIEENVLRRPAELHEGALLALQEANVIGEPNLLTWAAIGILTIGLVFMIPRVSYDRMGVGRREERWLNWFAWTSIVGKLVVVIAGTIVVLIIALRIVLSLEGEEAISRNVDNTLLEFDFLEAVAWMFTFIASGYENDVFPLSNLARVSVAFLAFVGLGLPLWFILNVVAEHAERVLDRDKGLHDQRLSGHTLVCGWNEKAPGVIYTLTCFQSPHRRKVVIVADMDSEQPVKEWRFHRGRVRFCRGDASMGRVLQRAKAHLAENAIVLASDDDDDQSGVLTALAVRKLNPTAFITAELARKSDEDYFTTSEVNKIVDPTEISNGAITLACFSSYALDYAMDALSPDEEAEWYSMEASKLDRLLARQNRPRTVGACIEALSEFNINVIGIASPTTMGNADEFVVDGTYIDPLYTTGSLSQEISDDSFVICAARNLLSFRLARTRFYLRRIANLIPGITSRQPSKVEVKSTAICTTKEPVLDILIVGGMEKATQLAEYMTRSIGREPDLLIVDGSESLGSMKAKLAEVQSDKPWTHVVVLAMPAQGRSKHSSSRIDAKTILRAHLIQDALKQRQLSPLLVSEVLNVDNRQLFEEADIDIVVPTAICTERILARMAAGRGFVSTMLTSLISREDGVYLTSIRLDENHTLVGEYFNDVLTTYFEDGRVMAVLPRVERDRFENSFDDFGTHFIMNPTAHNPKLEADDIVIVLRHA